METSFFHRLGSILWGGIVVLMVMLAIYVSVGRMITSNMTAFRTEILQELNARVPFFVEAEQVSGQWQSFSPEIILTGLRLSFAGSSGLPVELSEGRIGIDILNSLRTRSLRMTRVSLTELSLHGELSREGKLRLTGFGSDGGSVGSREQLQEFLLNVDLLSLRDNRLLLTMPDGEVRDLGLDLLLSRDRSQRRVGATLSSTGGAIISVLAEGVGDPFEPEQFSGQVYLDIKSTDLGAAKALLPERWSTTWAEGALDLQLWLAWDEGVPSVEARLEARNLLIAGSESSWQVPLERIALQAHLQRRKNHWTLFIADMEVGNGDVALTLPRLQLDSWGNALRVRAKDVPLGPISALIAEMEAAPENLRAVVTTLQPRGLLPSIQVSVGDIEQPVADWDLEANFEAVALEPFKGAPGTRSATGYTHLVPGGGFVVLDSQSVTLDFPTIYHDPLHFDDLHGTVNLNWDADNFSIASGLLTTHGAEGTAKVLFGLNIPRAPTEPGIEMDLLVGLQDMHPTYRVKYVPYVLAPTLQKWLQESIGEGRIEQGAFLWRGSFRKNAAPLHTVQLAFNVTDTQLNYDPRWPPVQVEEGIVLIDDSKVSVWAERASLFESTVERLSVETRLNASGQLYLGLEGEISGPAADGLRVLNESPLAGVVGSAFGDWLVTGGLETELALQMNLSDKSTAPQVDVATRWRDVELTVQPGNLSVQGVNGNFDYSTSQGFSSRDLRGTLWGEAVTVNLEQRHRDGGDRYDPASSRLDVELMSAVDMADVLNWLHLKPLAFARGETVADVGIRLSRGTPPLLTVASNLKGVSLDLPRPWQKDADDSVNLYLEMPLAQGTVPLSVSLGEELKFRLDVSSGVLRGGALGVNEEPGPATEGVLLINGHAPLIQGDDWLVFVDRYIVGADAQAQAEPDPTASAAAAVESGEGVGSGVDWPAAEPRAFPLEVVIDNFQADSLVIMGEELEDVAFSLALEQARWRFSLETDWVTGNFSLEREEGISQLDIEHLDLDRLPDFDLSGESEKTVQDIPLMGVTLTNLFQSDQRLGALSFELHREEDVFSARKITGELAGLHLPAERPGQLVWDQGEEAFTELQATLEFEDLGRTLEYFGYQRIVETESGQFRLDLRWPGTPPNFSLREGQGSMQVEIGPGSFLEAPPGTVGALRVANILNLTDIVRRISLSNKFDSGVLFESVNGEIFLHGGTLEVARINVEGTSSFQFSGVTNVESQSLSGKLVATLPVASNLPWIAALAASLPVAAAGVFVVSKVFDAQINRLSSAVYTIGGTWSDPLVDFDHFFNTSRAEDTTDTRSKVKAGAVDTGESQGQDALSADEGSPAPAQSESP